MNDLDEILNGEPAEAPVETPEANPAEGKVEQPRDEAGKFAKGDNGDAPPASEEKSKEKGQEAAIVAERRKRQEAEDRLSKSDERFQMLERQVQMMQQPTQQPKEPEPPADIWGDTEGWQQQFGTQIQTQAVQQASLQSKLQTSQMLARQQHTDFAEVYDDLNKFLSDNPSLMEKALNGHHPWDEAYTAYKSHQTMQELGATNIDDLKAELRKQVEAEMAQSAPQIPSSLAAEQSARGDSAAPAAPPSLDEILGG